MSARNEMQTGASETSLPDQQALEKLVGEVLEMARAQGADAAEAAVSAESGLSVTVRMGEVETIEFNRDKGLGITVYMSGRKGSASSTDFTPAALQRTVQAACDLARYTAEDPCAGLAPAERMASVFPDLELCHPWSLGAEQAVTLARECEAAALDYDARINNSEGGSVSSHESCRVYANTHGFVGGKTSTYHSASCAVIAEQDGAMERDYWYDVNREPGKLMAMADIGRQAAQRTVSRLGARQLSTRKVPVIYSADVAVSLLGHFVGAVRGANLYRKSSFLLDKLGEQIFPDWLRIHEQPLLKRALGSDAFDHEGVATQARDIVRDGVLQGYVLDQYAACRLGMQTTANAGGTHNLTVGTGDKDLPGLLAEMGTGLLVTELMGSSVNMVTGHYSRGAAGFWVENGELAYPVAEITVAGNLADMFRNIVSIGKDIDTRRSTRTGSILISEMTIAGE
jgi:PmbA protein